MISWGACRVIVGTKGLDEQFLDSAIAMLGSERVGVAVDIKDGRVAVEGWKKTTAFEALGFISSLALKGIKWAIYTDISRDGTMQGVDIERFRELEKFKEIKIIASGGINTLDDVKGIEQEIPFIHGVIIGRALYEGKIDLSEALSYGWRKNV